MAQFRGAETWSELVSNSGARTAVVNNLLKCEVRAALDGTDAVELDFPKSDPAGATVANRQVIRLTYQDESFSEWRVQSIREQSSADGIKVSVTAVTPLQDMADTGALYELSSAGVPQFLIGLSLVSIEEVLDNYILPHLTASGRAYFAKGTIEPTELYDVQLRKMTPLAALRYLCDLARDETTKRPAELRVRRNGTSGYLIDVLRSIGSTAPVADLRYRKNLRRTDLTTDSERQTNVVQPFGGDLPDGVPSGIGRVAFRLGTPTGLVYPITDPEGFASPILFADQLNGMYVVPDADNALVEITDSAPGTPATVTLASSTGITAGKVYELRKNVAGEFLSEMPASGTITDRQVQQIERSDLLGVRNLIGNGWLRLWPDADQPPTDHGYFGDETQLSKNTDPLYTQLGGASLKLESDGNAGVICGLRTPIAYPASAVGLQLHCAKVRVFFKEFSGAAWFYLRIVSGLDGSVIKLLTLVAADNPIEGGYVPTVGSWVDVSLINVDLIDFNADGVRVECFVGGGYGGTVEGSVECYIDAIQLTQTVGEAPESYIEYSGSNALWREGNRVLSTFVDPPEHYEIDVDDLTRFDGTAFPFDELVVGGIVRLTEPSLGIDASLLRIVESNVDLLAPRRTQLKVASRWEQFVELAVPGGAALGVSTKPVVTPGEPPQPPIPPNDGTGAGTPGNTGVFHFVAEAGGLYVLGTQPPESTWLSDTGHFQVPSQFSTAITVWAHPVVAGVEDSVLDVEYSIDDGVSWTAIGVQPRLDILAPQIVSATLPVEARVAGTIYRAAAAGGDDESSPEIYNFAFALRSNAPIGLPTPPPPGTIDPPTGTPWGNIIRDANAPGAEMDAAYNDTDDVDSFIDSVAGNNLTSEAVLLLPKYNATGLNGKPCVEWDGANVPLIGPDVSHDYGSWTVYIVAENLNGGDGADIWNGLPGGTYSYGISADSTVFGVQANNVFGAYTIIADSWDMSQRHIYRLAKSTEWAHWYFFVDGVLKGSAFNAIQTNDCATSTLMDYRSGLGLSGRIGRVLEYDQAHISPTNSGSVANGLTGPELALRAYWGTP